MKPDALVVEQAKRFLKDRIIKQAAEENVLLSEAEIATLSYSEPSASESERKLADEVDDVIGAEEYEEKVTALLRHAYKRDVQRGMKDEWEKNLETLHDQDLYVLVMVQNAGIAKTPSLSGVQVISLSPPVTLDMLCIGVVGLIGFLVLFTPLGSFLQPDWVRFVLFFAWIMVLWLLGEWSRRRTFRNL